MHILEKGNWKISKWAADTFSYKTLVFHSYWYSTFQKPMFSKFYDQRGHSSFDSFSFCIINLSVNSVGFDQFCKLKSNVFKMAMKLSIMQYHNHLTRDIFCPSLHFIL